MKGFSKAIIVLLMMLSLMLLASCGDKDKDEGNGKNDSSDVVIDTEDGVSGPILPWPFN